MVRKPSTSARSRRRDNRPIPVLYAYSFFFLSLLIYPECTWRLEERCDAIVLKFDSRAEKKFDVAFTRVAFLRDARRKKIRSRQQV